jgi:type IVB pilus formation R64 PilN family outer membrane protein
MRTFTTRLPRLSALAVALAVASLSGCAQMQQTHEAIKQATQQVDNGSATIAAHASAPVVRSLDGAWLMGQEVPIHKQPSVLSQSVQMATAQPLTLAQAAMTITQQTGVPVSVAANIQEGGQSEKAASPAAVTLPGLPGNPASALTLPALPGVSATKSQVVINYSGTLKGLLDLLAAQTRTYWKYDESTHGVRFFLTETRVFEVDALPGNTKISSVITNAGSSGSAGGTSGGIASTGTSSMTSTLDATMDAYKAIEAGVKSVLKQSGGAASSVSSVSVDPSSGQVIVTATPPELDAVARYIQTINRQMSRNVLIDVHVYSITLNNSQSAGLNLSGALSGFLGGAAGSLKLAAGGAAAVANGGNIAANIISGNVSGNAIAQALNSQGKVSLVTSGSVIALNGQPAPLQVSTQNGYLAASTTTNTPNVGSSTSLTPGSVISGFSGTFLPLVRGDKILMEYALNLTQNLGFLTQSSNGSTIQVPNTASQTTSNRVSIHSGDTVVLTGFDQIGHQTNGQVDVGDASSSASKTRTALVITMHVVNLGS